MPNLFGCYYMLFNIYYLLVGEGERLNIKFRCDKY